MIVDGSAFRRHKANGCSSLLRVRGHLRRFVRINFKACPIQDDHCMLVDAVVGGLSVASVYAIRPAWILEKFLLHRDLE